MNHSYIPGINKPISRLVQGTIMLRTDQFETDAALLDEVYEAGCTTFDTAQSYGGGESDRTLGLWMESRGNREQVVILGKGAHHSRDRQRVTPYDISSDLHDSLARLRTEYIDLYVLHRDDPSKAVGPIVDVLNQHVQAGKIHAFGGSNWSVTRLQEANTYAEANGLQGFSVSSPNYSMAVQKEVPWPNCISISGPHAAAERAWYQETRMPLFVWSSLAGGFLTGRFRPHNLDSFSSYYDEMVVRCYCTAENFARIDRAEEVGREKGLTLPQVALAYVLDSPMNVYALVGCHSGAEFRENAHAADIGLTAQEREYIEGGA